MGRDKYTDYITYIILCDNIIYLLPFLLLQKAWLNNYKEWVSTYGRKFAQNDGYKLPIFLFLQIFY